MLWLQNSNLSWGKEQKGFASLLEVNSIIIIAQAGILKGDEPSAFDLICWMFTTTFLHNHHSLLAKLSRWGWLMRMRLDWKKSQNALDTSNRIHRNKTRSTGSVGKGLGSQLCHDWELHTRKQAGLFLPIVRWKTGYLAWNLALRLIQCFIAVCGSLWSTDHKSKVCDLFIDENPRWPLANMWKSYFCP